jgi:hypothetical protein
MQSTISFSRKKLILSPNTSSVEIKNESKKELIVNLKLVGSKTFSIPKKTENVMIKPGLTVRVPVEFEIDRKMIGWPMALSAVKKAGIQVWSADPKKKKELLGIISVSAVGPVMVPMLRCMEPRQSERQEKKKGNSPPGITMSAVKPGTTIPKNTGTVELSYTVERADEIWDLWLYPEREVLEPGTFTGAGGSEISGHVTPSEDSFTYTPGSTLFFSIHARNTDGETHEGESIYHKARVGYHDARCPAGASINTDELDEIRAFLDDIDGRLRANVLEDLPSFIERWNSSCPYEDYQFPEFDDMEYLSGRVGSGSLADDILAAMRDVLIYVKPPTLPRGHRPGTTSGDDHALCETWVCTPEGGECTVVGRTYYSPTDPDCNWIGICREIGADVLTLLHELYHYATGSDDEAKAVAMSCCAFDYIPAW